MVNSLPLQKTAPIVVHRTAELVQSRERVGLLASVSSKEEADYARDWLTVVQRAQDELTAERESRTRPHLDELKTIRDEYRTADELCDAMIAHLKHLLGHYELACRQLQQEAFARAARAHEVGDHIEARVEIATSNALAQSGKPEGVTVREVWRAEIVDASAVPREWCCPDEKRIAAVARAVKGNDNPPPIPGVRYVKEAAVSNRRKGK